jgi:hypothetical protein
MGRRPLGERAPALSLALGFFVPALLAGSAVLLLTGNAGPAPGPAQLGLASASISAVPRVGDAAAEGETSDVRRIVTGRTVVSGSTTEPGLDPVEPRPAEPARVIIPEVGVDASVVPVGATTDGIEVPPVYEAGWYAEGPRPSEPGRAVVLGHLDSLTGPAAFTQVPQARPGADVTVVDQAGVSHEFEVLRSLEVAKSSFPVAEVYGATRRPSLALITCGGDFDPETGYENNVIVFARELRRS